MSASLLWRFADSKYGRIAGIGSASAFIASMDRAFGASPWVLDRSALEVLRGMEAMYTDEGENPYTDMVSKIVGDDGASENVIEVWPEY